MALGLQTIWVSAVHDHLERGARARRSGRPAFGFSELASSSTGWGGPSSKEYCSSAGWIMTREFMVFSLRMIVR